MHEQRMRAQRGRRRRVMITAAGILVFALTYAVCLAVIIRWSKKHNEKKTREDIEYIGQQTQIIENDTKRIRGNS